VLVGQAGGAVGGGVRVGEGAAAGVLPGAAGAGLELAVTALELGAVVVELVDDAQPAAAAMQTSTAAVAASGPAGLPAPGFPVPGFPASDFTAVPSLWSTTC